MNDPADMSEAEHLYWEERAMNHTDLEARLREVLHHGFMTCRSNYPHVGRHAVVVEFRDLSTAQELYRLLVDSANAPIKGTGEVGGG